MPYKNPETRRANLRKWLRDNPDKVKAYRRREILAYAVENGTNADENELQPASVMRSGVTDSANCSLDRSTHGAARRVRGKRTE